VTRTKRAVVGALAGAFLALTLGPRDMRSGPQTDPPDPPPQGVQRPSHNYMGDILSRSTKPLGLKEDPAARRMLGQGSVAWAIRAGSRHVLD
jgi:hypothetical protein